MKKKVKQQKPPVNTFHSTNKYGIFGGIIASSAICGMLTGAIYLLMTKMKSAEPRAHERRVTDLDKMPEPAPEDYEIIYCYPHELVAGDIVLNTFGKVDAGSERPVNTNQ